MHQQVKRISKFTKSIKTNQLAIFKVRTKKRYIFCFLYKAKNWPHPNDIAETITRGGVLEDTFSSPWPWPRSLKSSKIALSSARGQHYFLNRKNLVGKRQKPRGKFANTFVVFLSWSIG